MAWTVEFHPEVVDDLDDLGYSAASKILRAIKDKIENGEPDKLGIPLRGALAGYRRIRVGDTRIVYRVDQGAVEVLIVAVGARRDKEVYHAAENRV
ncbi:type II toxin-antitoxin system RelE/ParE family toxin [Pseudomonas sp. P7]|jgi:mRNA interferase RelE/StbE|uniref:Type II toxin-antitoxin system RelE/ParE family toxin n=1 Tax=Pseudomonas haemolytica TaxID=2600065 RepID=A0A646P6H8_9PSED|nr:MULTISPECIES: type II toxin-antitoxin system RelE/ParE family toxin [Pseudomonas]MBJ2238303.1 type II toxin-antitoxin system RelE/ParE family toxin [Pseudomonas fluorescens]MBA2926882.1 type II toxin-antitoxin system RelE/ParE family toxin [Pseudomonas sivasensis]MBH3370423.1 type II toxin-antitoxin system RelE/ParE family toxin [Pseudomonas carnis]MBJ2233005.1 type II toxin-antitoxin system RelE/ParE family toxin [Pseudomonas simiae]MBJ2274214.1 type II toxin-antitoxin system RelE/ParE fam